jgi:cytochrome P450
VGRTLIERRLRDLSDRMKAVGRDLAVAEEQLAHFEGDADDARLRALVSETPGAEQVHREAQRHAEAMRRHRDDLVAELRQLEASQDDLLDRLLAAAP